MIRIVLSYQNQQICINVNHICFFQNFRSDRGYYDFGSRIIENERDRQNKFGLLKTNKDKKMEEIEFPIDNVLRLGKRMNLEKDLLPYEIIYKNLKKVAAICENQGLLNQTEWVGGFVKC